ncbi:MAG: CsgG/HfaB family protein [Flavobacteriales bacterium]|nr:CsgG/HfaB family protein [Flavobacteriales bacterium]
MIERTRLNALLREQNLGTEAIIDDSTRAEFRRLSRVDAMIGTISLFENDLRLTMRAIDAQTGSMVKVEMVDVGKNNRIRVLPGEATVAGEKTIEQL